MKRVLVLATAACCLALPAAAAPIKAGKWETTLSMEIPGLGGMRTTTNDHCITPEEAEAGPKDIFNQTDGQCDMTDYEFSDGKVKMHLVCEAEGGTMDVTSNGTYTETTYSMDTVTKASFGANQMTMQSKAEGRYIGPCYE